MKTKYILKTFIGLLALAVVAFSAAGCSQIADAQSESVSFGRVAFNVDGEKPLTNIKLYRASKNDTSKKVSCGTWANSAALKAASISIPTGEYEFTLYADYDESTFSGTCDGVIKANETTSLSFKLTRVNNKTGSSGIVDTGDDGEVEERVKTGTIVNVDSSKPEAKYNGYYKVMDWDATKYVFTTSTSTTGVSGAFPSAEEWLASDDLSTGQVAILGGCETKYNATAKQCDYLKLKKNSGKLKFDVPIDTKYIVFYCKNANSGGTTVAMKVSLADGSADSKSVTVNAPNDGSYVYQEFAYSLTATDGEDSKSIIIENTDSTNGLNIKKIQVYAEGPWNRAKKTTSAKLPGGASDYNTPEIVVDLTLNTDGTTSGSSITVLESAGWLNSAYVIFDDKAASYTITCDGKAVDNELLRHYSTYKYNESSYKDGQTTWSEDLYSNVCRVDVLGLAAGNHTISITPAGGSATTVTMKVLDHDRSGYGFTGSTTPGAYKADGTLKDNAIVIYVTDENKTSVSYTTTAATSKKAATYKGFVAKGSGADGILSEDFLKNLTVPVCFRIIGTIEKNGLSFASNEGIQIKTTSDKGVTIEGVGHDASFHGFGVLVRSAKYTEISNLGILLCMDDGISVDTGNEYLWLHNNDIFYGGTGSDSDQAKGDGALDFKKSKSSTISYNHFWDTGKSNLLDASAGNGSDELTYHHNWYDHSDSRHPRIRNSKHTHVYNNYYDGNAKYGIGITTGACALSECNFFRNAHDPIMSSNQGTDAQGDGTFSGEDGGWIKSYGDKFTECNANGVKFQFTTNKDKGWEAGDADIDCYIVDNITDEVPSTLKTVKGGTSYNNFDKNRDSLHLTVPPTDAATARAMVCMFSGRRNPDFAWTFDNATQDANYGVIKELKSAVVAYKNTGLTKIGN